MLSKVVFEVYAEAQKTADEMSQNIDLYLLNKGVRTPDELSELDRLEWNQMIDDRDAIFHHLMAIDESIQVLSARLNISVS